MGNGPGWQNPIVGGTTLRIPAIQSPNFSLVNQTGWAIFADGTAYFFNVTAAGTITGASLVVDGATGGVFIYSGTPGPGNLIGTWAGTDGEDLFGNTWEAGLNVGQGTITGVDIDSTTITNSTFQGDVLDESTISNPTILGGTVTETEIVFDTTGGQLLVYASTTTVVTQTANGTYTFTPPAGVTQAKVEMWGAGAGGDGGTTSEGGNGGGAPTYSAEPNYPLTPLKAITYVVGNGGNASTTGQGHGGDGGQSFFDNGGVLAPGGLGNGQPGALSSNTVSEPGGTGGNSTGAFGAGSGANSGFPTGNGHNGNTPSGSTGGAQPAAQTGAGRGGIGGNDGANGGNGGGPGGSGGGAGRGTSSTGSKTLTYEALYTGSYFGPDATAFPNALRSTSLLYQGGETASGGTANGNQRSIMAFDRAQIAADFAGYTITGTTVKLVNQHSWFSGGMTFTLDTYAGLPGSVPSSYPASDFVSQVATGTIAEGATHVYTLGAGLGNGFANGSLNGLGLGAEVAANAPYNLNYYGWFTGGHGTALEMTITGTISSAGSNTSGTGADGQSKITYTSGQTLIAAVSPMAGNDGSNAFGAAYTGLLAAFHPGSNPTTVETWQTMTTFTNGWTAGSTPPQYRMNGLGEVEFRGSVAGTSASAAQFFVLPSAYWPKSTAFIVAAATAGVIAGRSAFTQISATGSVSAQGVTIPTSGMTWTMGGSYDSLA